MSCPYAGPITKHGNWDCVKCKLISDMLKQSTFIPIVNCASCAQDDIQNSFVWKAIELGLSRRIVIDWNKIPNPECKDCGTSLTLQEAVTLYRGRHTKEETEDLITKAVKNGMPQQLAMELSTGL